MQSIFRLPWCTDTLGGGEPKPDVVTLQKMRQAPIVDFPLLNKLKRKRSDSPELLQTDREVKRKRPCDAEMHLLHTQHAQPGNYLSRQAPAHDHAYQQHDSQQDLDTPDNMSPDVSRLRKVDDGLPLASTTIVPSALSPLQQTIEHQFNIEILMKHKELRLIDQEIAKCQIALEQLRRCELVPYPTNGLSQDVSLGTGPALRAQQGSTQPTAPAPWGVADGPYSRHLSSWLLPDPTFDSTSPQAFSPQDFGSIRGDGRPSRNSGVSWAKPTKSRVNRESVSSFSPTVPAPAPSRSKNGPLVLKRMSDNQFVKLVCTKCHRSDFSSVQGFLNHCRIAHKIDYKSHEAAAQDCGHPLEEHEADLAATAPPPVGSTVRTPAPKPPPPAAPVVSRVHQYAQDILPRPTWKRQRLAYIQALNSQPSTPSSLPVATAASQTPLIRSTTAPHLSSHLERRGVGLDLASIVAKLCEKVDLGLDEPEEIDDSQSSIATPTEAHTNGGMRMVSGGKLGERPQSKKGFNQSGQRPRPAPLAAPLQHPLSSAEIPESPQDHDLSPNTADSNPGLVSDHEDDPVSDSEEAGSVIVPTNPIHIHQGCGGDAMDLDVEVEDDHDGHGVIIRSRGSMQQDTDMPGSPSRPRSKYGRREK